MQTDNPSDPGEALPALPPTAAVAPIVRKRSGRGLAFTVLLFVLLVLLAAWWRFERGESARIARQAESHSADLALKAGLAQLKQETARLDHELETQRQRLADSERVNRALREELLGLNERADLVEDALANLADGRLAGRDALLLNEAEFLLLLGAERMTLYRDAGQSLAAYRLADAALAGIDEPALASLRQTVAAEMSGLSAAAQAGPAQRSAEIAALRTQLEALPLRSSLTLRSDARQEDAKLDWLGRLGKALTPLVRVRSVDAQSAVLMNPLHAGLRRSLLLLELSHAEAANANGESAVLRRALQRAQILVGELFDPNAPEVATAFNSLQRLLAAETTPLAPELGAALKELRNLRATRALAVPALGAEEAAVKTP